MCNYKHTDHVVYEYVGEAMDCLLEPEHHAAPLVGVRLYSNLHQLARVYVLLVHLIVEAPNLINLGFRVGRREYARVHEQVCVFVALSRAWATNRVRGGM